MNKQAQAFIKLGAKGTFEWLNESYDDSCLTHKKIQRGTFEVVKITSLDFVVSVVFENGEKKASVWCSLPKATKPITEKRMDGALVESQTFLGWLSNGFHQITETKITAEGRPTNISAFSRVMIFS